MQDYNRLAFAFMFTKAYDYFLLMVVVTMLYFTHNAKQSERKQYKV
jgi:hypothetical protein